MAISHVFTNPVPDGTITSIVRPSDWNSAHNQYYTLSGNVLGASTVSGTNVVLQAAGNVSLSGVNQTIIISGSNTPQPTSYVSNINGLSGAVSLAAGSSLSSSVNGSSVTFGLASNITTALQSANPNYLTVQTVQTQASGNIAGTGFTSTTTAGTAVTGALGTNGINLGIPAYLTTARASNDAVGLNTAQTNVTWTVNSSGISLNAAGYAGTNLSTANVSATLNSSGLTLSAPAVSALSNGNNITISNTGTNVGISAQAVAVGAGTQTATSGTVNFVNSNGVTFGMSGSNQITASVAAPGGAGNFNLSGATSGNTTATGNTINLSGINITLSGTNGSQIAISAPATSSLSAGNNISITSNGSTIGLSALAIGLNTAGTNITWTANSSGLSINAAGYAGTGFTSTTTAGTAVQGTLGTNGLSLGIPAYVTNAAGGNFSGGVSNLGNTAGSTGITGTRIVFVGTNNISLSQSTDANGATISINQTGGGGGPTAYVASLNGSTGSISLNVGSSLSSSTLGSSITFGLASNITTALQSANANYLTSQSNPAFSASGGSNTFQTLSFANTNGVTFSNSNGSVQVTHDLQYTSNTSAITANALNTSASRVINIVAATNNAGGGTASLSSNVSFSNANGITFYTSAGGAVVASYTVPTVPTSYVSNVNGSSGAISLNVGSSLSSSTAGSSITFGLASNITTALQSAGAYLTTAAQSSASNLSIAVAATNNTGGGTATLASSISFTNANGMTFYTSAGNAIAASYTVPTQSVQTQASGAIAGTGFTSTTTVGTAVTAALGTNGLNMAIPVYLTTQSVQTQASGNIAGSGFSSTTTVGTAIVGTNNSLGLSLGIPAYLTTQSVQTQASGNLAGIGFTSTTTAGTAVVGTLSTNGLSLGIPAYVTNVAGGNFSGGVSNLGNTAGSTGITGTRIVFVGTNNISLSQSTDANGATISINQTGAAGAMYANLSGATSGNTTASGNTLNFSGINVTLSGTNASQIAISAPATSSLSAGNNISLSSNGSTIGLSALAIGLNTAATNVTWTANSSGLSINAAGYAGTGTSATNASVTLNSAGLAISVAAPGAANYSIGVSNLGNTAGSTGITGTRIVFVGTNNISLSQSTDANGATISINQTGNNFSAGISSLGNTNTALSSGITGTRLVFAAYNNITLGQLNDTAGATISIVGANLAPIASGYSPHGDYPLVVGQIGQGTLAFDPDIFPDLTLNMLAIPINFSAATNSTGSFTLSNWVGLYSRNVSSLSLAHSTSFTTAITFSGTANSASYHGWRNITYPWSTSVSGGRYWIAQGVSTTTGGAACSFSQYLASQVNTNFSGAFGAATNATAQFTLGQGFYSAATGALPGSIAFTDIRGTNSLAQRFPIVQFGFNSV